MVNYCCVHLCGRNSRLNKHLNYYSLPKERHRQIEWLKAAQREDLLTKNEEKVAVSYRFCSRHFSPSSIKNRHLSPDAVPTLCLPGSWATDDVEPDPPVHVNIICDNCSKPIMGFRYKCVNCVDYDLCQKCEMHEAHPDHFMLRMPKPLKFKLADNLIKKWRHLFKEAHVMPSNDDSNTENSCASSDDEPIRKYKKNYDSGVDLSEDVKLIIRKEISRSLKVKSPDVEKVKVQKKDGAPSKKRTLQETERPIKRKALLNNDDRGQVCEVVTAENHVPDLVFADVNEMNDEQIIEASNELNSSIASIVPNADYTIVIVKTSDNLPQLITDITENPNNIEHKF